ANVHGRTLVEQRLAEPQRLDLDDVVAGRRERNADDLERSRIAAGERRQVEPGRTRLLGQQRDLARADIAVDAALDDATFRILLFLDRVPVALGKAELARGHLRLVVFLQARVPGEDVGIAQQGLDANLARGLARAGRGSAEVALDVAKRH